MPMFPPAAHGGIGQGLVQMPVEPLHDLGRRAGGGEQAEPFLPHRRGVVQFLEGRHVGEEAAALVRGHRQRPEPAGRDARRHRARRGPDARRAIGDGAGAGGREQGPQGARSVGRHDQHAGRTADEAEGSEVRHRVVGSGLVVDDDLGAQGDARSRGDPSGDAIGRAPGRARHDDGDRPAGRRAPTVLCGSVTRSKPSRSSPAPFRLASWMQSRSAMVCRGRCAGGRCSRRAPARPPRRSAGTRRCAGSWARR